MNFYINQYRIGVGGYSLNFAGQVCLMYCRDCVFFKLWKSFGAAMCEATSKSVEPLDRACDSFTPKGRFSEWGEETCGGGCR